MRRLVLLTSSQTYVRYNDNKDMPTPEQSVFVQGGAGVMQKRGLITNYGVKTDVTDDEYSFLKTNKLFQQHVDGGWIKVIKATSRREDMDLMVSDMQARDGGSQLVPNDFTASKDMPIANGKRADGSEITTKPRSRPYTFGVGGMNSAFR
jgi:hypothetical protein